MEVTLVGTVGIKHAGSIRVLSLLQGRVGTTGRRRSRRVVDNVVPAVLARLFMGVGKRWPTTRNGLRQGIIAAAIGNINHEVIRRDRRVLRARTRSDDGANFAAKPTAQILAV